MNRCRLKGEFEYIKYTGENKGDVLQVLLQNGYTDAQIGNYDLFLYCKFNYNTLTMTDNITVVNPGEYLVVLEPGKVEKYPEQIFELSFVPIDDLGVAVAVPNNHIDSTIYNRVIPEPEKAEDNEENSEVSEDKLNELWS